MRLGLICLLAVSLPVAAQVERFDGALAPAQSFALQDDGTSLAGNPGGLGYAEGLELDFLHNGLSPTGYDGHTEALLATAGAGPIALGVGIDWLHLASRSPPGAASFFTRRISYGVGLRQGMLGVGAVYRTRSNSYSSWDVGALLRPSDWFSFGVSALAVDEPKAGSGTVPRRWAFSLGIRPTGGRLELAADMRWNECTSGAINCGLDHRDVFFTASAKLFEGLHLVGQAGLLQTFLFETQRFALVGLQADLSHLGVTWGPRFEQNASGQADYRVRLSTERWPSLSVPLAHAALIDLDKALSHPSPGPLALVFGGSAPDPLAQTIAALRRLSRDGSVQAVVLRTSGMPLGLGKAEELRAAIEGLRRSGKRVLFYLESGGDLEYSVATSADRIYAAPQAVLLVNGFAATALFAAAGLDKLGVKAEFFRVGAYKNAPDLFTRSGMSGEQREVENSLLDDLYGRYVGRIAEQRHLDQGRLRTLLDKGIVSPAEALREGLLDGLLYPDQLEEEVRKVLGHQVALRKTPVTQDPVRESRWGPKRKIEVIRVEGQIARGEGARDPFGMVKVAGAAAVSRRIRDAADDPRVAAIVVRIDSPGGDGNASDLIWRELVRARKEKKKPVIASMGDVAASGGYYLAAGADEIFAEPSTITGSIGVFIGHFDASELFSSLGLNLVTVKRGASADLFSPGRSLTDAERKTLQSWVEGFYSDFLDRVAIGRGLQKPEVDEVARGRVWTGAQALSHKLVDRLGGLEDALAEARRLSGGGDAEVHDEVPHDVQLSDVAMASVQLPAGLLPRVLRSVSVLGEPGTLRAILPFDLEVR